MKTVIKSIGVAAIVLAAVCIPQISKADSDTASYVNHSNTVSVAGSILYGNAVLAASTNYFNLSTSMGSQANTNLWPANPIKTQNNTFLPSRIVCYQDSFNLMGSGTSAFVKRYAGSVDGTHWQTNPCPLVITETAAGTGSVEVLTNVDTGAIQYYSLYSEENPNASAVTNVFIATGFDRGL